MSPQVVILAGGLATRLGELTKSTPKSMLLICGEPFIKWQLMLLRSKGIKRVHLCLGHLGEVISEYLELNNFFGLEVTLKIEENGPLGTGGAISHSLDYLDENFLLLYGDSYLDVDFINIYQAYLNQNKSSLMTIIENSNKWDTSNVRFEGNEIIEYSKNSESSNMKYVDYGLSVISRKNLANYNFPKTWDISEYFKKELLNHHLAPYVIYERFYEIGSADGIYDLECYLSTKDKNNR